MSKGGFLEFQKCFITYLIGVRFFNVLSGCSDKPLDVKELDPDQIHLNANELW